MSVKICQLLHNTCSNNLYDKFRTNRSNGVEGLQSTNCNKLVCVFSHVSPEQYTDVLVWPNFSSPKCRNYSLVPDHADLTISHHKANCQMLKSVALTVQDILTKAVHVILIHASFRDEFFHRQGKWPNYIGLPNFLVSRCSRYEAVNGGAKYRKRRRRFFVVRGHSRSLQCHCLIQRLRIQL